MGASSWGTGAARRTRTGRGPNRSPARAGENRRSASPRTPAPAIRRAAGTRRASPNRSVRNPGTTSSSALSSPTTPSLTCAPTGCPELAAARSARQARTPSRRSNHPPSTVVARTSSTVSSSPSSRATNASRASSSTAPSRTPRAINPIRRCMPPPACRGRVRSAPSAAEHLAQRLQTGPRSPQADPPERLPHDRRAHLARAALALGEGDRYLGDPEPALVRPPDQVDLEAVPLRGDRVDLDLLQHRHAVGAVPAGGVPVRHAQRQPGVQVAAAGQDLPAPGPVDHGAAGDVPGAEHRVVVAQRLQQPGQLLGGVGAVGVHLHDRLVPVLAGPREAGHVRRAQALLTGPVQDVDLLVGGGQLVGDRTGAVRAVVVGHQDVDLGDRLAYPADDDPDVLGLVVRGNHHEHPADSRVARTVLRCRGVLAHSSSRVCRIRLRSSVAAASPSTPRPTSISSGAVPTAVASVRSVPRRSCRTRTARVLKPVRSVARPSAVAKPEIPTVETISASRPCSTARSRTMANCCPASAGVKSALLVCTASRSAPPVTVSRTRSS